VHIPDLFDKYFSFLAMHEQLKEFRKIAEEVMNKSTDGVHLIGFSQGKQHDVIKSNCNPPYSVQLYIH